ncbi:MAG: hypothetical protein AAF656_09785 [Planctomycetota bacterium]
MATFRFVNQIALDQAGRKVDQAVATVRAAEAQVESARGAVAQQEKKVEVQTQRERESVDQLRNRRGLSGPDLAELAEAARWARQQVDDARTMLTLANKRLDDEQAVLDERRAQLTDARRKHAGLENLREQALAEFKKEQRRREEKQMDDRAIERFNREPT